MKRALFLLVLCCGALATGCAQKHDTVAATVNGIQVPTQAVVDELNAISANPDYLNQLDGAFKQQGQSVKGADAGTFDANFVSAVVRRQMQFALMHDEIERRGLQPNDDCKASAQKELLLGLGQNDAQAGQALYDKFPADYQQQLQEWYDDEFVLQADLVQQPCGSAETTKAYFDAHQDDFAQSCISVIGVNDETLANSIVQQVRAGGDFAALASANSTDATTAPNGGDGGCHALTDFPSTVAPIVQGTAVGGVTDPISNNQGGFVIIKVNSRTPANFADVAAQAEEFAARDQSVEFSSWLQKAQQAAHVTVDPRYGTFDPQNFSITPPNANVSSDSSVDSSVTSSDSVPTGP